jgi:hypothetical protein
VKTAPVSIFPQMIVHQGASAKGDQGMEVKGQQDDATQMAITSG